MGAKIWLFGWHLLKSIYLYFTTLNINWSIFYKHEYITEQCLFNCFIHCCAAHFVRVLRTWKAVCKHIFRLYKMSHWRWIWILWALYIIAKKHPWSGPSTSTQYISTLHNYLTLNLFHLRRGESRDDLCNICLSLSLSPSTPFYDNPWFFFFISCLVVLSCAPHLLLHINPYLSMQYQNFSFSQSQRLDSLSIRLCNRFSRLRLSK